MISAVIFDIDGTLYNETDAKMVAELSVSKYLHENSDYKAEYIYNRFRKIKHDITRMYKGLPKANDRVLWFEALLNDLKLHSITHQSLSDYYWDSMYKEINIYVDFKYILHELKSKYRLFALTDELIDIHRKKIFYLGLEGVFEKTISSEQVGETKPSSTLFEYAIRKIGEDKNNILIVGDNPEADINGGNCIGIRTAWLRRGKYYYYHRENSLEYPDIEFTNYLQLIPQIERL